MGSFQILNFQTVSIWHKIRVTLPSSPPINTIKQTLLHSESQRTSSHCCSLAAVTQTQLLVDSPDLLLRYKTNGPATPS